MKTPPFLQIPSAAADRDEKRIREKQSTANHEAHNLAHLQCKGPPQDPQPEINSSLLTINLTAMASKILSINISGMVFPMTEEAYETLQSYLGSIKKCFASHQDREEIIADLESRMAEHFSEKVSSKHQVLLKKDVEALILIMGRAEDFELEKDQWEEGSLESSFLYRDGEGAIIGGVCAGLGHYLKIDPLLIRLVFFLSLFAGGLGLLIYLLLWIVVPEAKTAFQKEQMRKGRFDLKKELKKLGKKIRQSVA